MKDRIWTASNLLSMFRVVLIVPVAWCITHESPVNNYLAFVLSIAAGFTDLFDGMLARYLNQVTELGKVIDPLADKLCVIIVVGILSLQGKIPLWFIAIAVARDIVILTGGIYVKRIKGIILMSNTAGKWAVAFIGFLVLVAELNMPQAEGLKNIFIGISTLLLAVSSTQYATRFWETVKN